MKLTKFSLMTNLLFEELAFWCAANSIVIGLELNAVFKGNKLVRRVPKSNFYSFFRTFGALLINLKSLNNETNNLRN